MTVERVIHVGCSDIPPGIARERYLGALDYLEVAIELHDPPKPATLRKRRRDLPDLSFGLMVGGFHVGVAAADAMATVAENVERLHAEVAVFHSIAAVTPSAANRDALRRFFAEVAPPERLGGVARAWEPHGLWQPADAAKLAADLGLIYVCDPLARDPFGPSAEFYAGLGEAAYFRLTGLGSASQDFSAHELELVAALAGSYPRAWVVLTNPGRFRDAVKLRQQIGAGGED